MKMIVGDVYVFNGNRVKVFMFDNWEVFFLSVDQNDELQFAKTKTLIYQRSPQDFFTSTAEFVYSSNLSSEHLDIHQPNLPLRLNCLENIFWANEKMNETEFNDFVLRNNILIDSLESLNCDQIALFPTSQLGANKKPTIITNPERLITGIQLLQICYQVQQEYVNSKKPYISRFRLIQDGREEKRLSGIGVYRLGIKGNIPSYYIGGSISMAELESNHIK
ncbi:MAG: hypothetical protein ACJASQ_002116 [Crocinitomicaceae bacterium]|jgi:hypothetical protein